MSTSVQLIWPWQDRSRRFSWLKAAAFALMFVPAISLAYQYATGSFGRLPLAGLTYWSGVWATAILLLALAVTPFRAILRWVQLVALRRMIGVTALAYTLGHIVIYFALRFWDFASIAVEMATRLTLVIATVSTIGLIALGATSLDAAIQYMGSANWNRLHNAVYALTALAIVHYLLSPGVYAMQYLMTGMFLWLMGWRLLDRRGLGADARALAALAAGTALCTAIIEAGWTWGYHGFPPSWALGNNFNLDFGLSPAWTIFSLGLLAALAAAARALRRAAAAR